MVAGYVVFALAMMWVKTHEHRSLRSGLRIPAGTGSPQKGVVQVSDCVRSRERFFLRDARRENRELRKRAIFSEYVREEEATYFRKKENRNRRIFGCFTAGELRNPVTLPA